MKWTIQLKLFLNLIFQNKIWIIINIHFNKQLYKKYQKNLEYYKKIMKQLKIIGILIYLFKNRFE